MLAVSKRKLLAKTLANYSVITLATLVVGQLPFMGTIKFSILNFFAGLFISGGWLGLALTIEPNKEESPYG